MGVHDGSSNSTNAEQSLNQGDNELIGVSVEQIRVNQASSQSTLNIASEFSSTTSGSGQRLKIKNCRGLPSCCICQAAWCHWRSQCFSRGVSGNNTEELTTSVAKTPTMKANSGSACRICLEERGPEGFISPCNCSGTMGMVHRSCLERWLSLLNTSECEICRKKFEVERNLRPVQQIVLGQLPLDVCGDLICIAFLSPICILIVYFAVEGSSKSVAKGRIAEAIVLISIATTAVVIFLIWICCTVKSALAYWLGNNRIVRLAVNQVGPERENNSRQGTITVHSAHI